jgi:hypothetical protein
VVTVVVGASVAGGVDDFFELLPHALSATTTSGRQMRNAVRLMG